MNLSEAKALLNDCTREELRDHAFGDAEVYWYNKAKGIVAEGYFGGNHNTVSFKDGAFVGASFSGVGASELRNCGTEGHIERNDETGPDEFVLGYTMPGLTIEGVRKELTEER